MITKVMKFELRYIDGCGEFHDLQNNLWDLRKYTRQILNGTVLAYHLWEKTKGIFIWEAKDGTRIMEEMPKSKLAGEIYRRWVEYYPEMSSANINQTIQVAKQKYTGSSKDVFVGNMSLPSYKQDQPLQVQ